MARADIEVTVESRARRVVQINRNELPQVVVNLLLNALRAMPDG